MTNRSAGPRFVRLAELERRRVQLLVNGRPVTALDGDTLLVALLASGARLRQSEFGDGERAGFCLMGACQDCWVRAGDGQRLRACSTPVRDGLAVYTTAPAPDWAAMQGPAS